jgi:hypothetical protein
MKKINYLLIILTIAFGSLNAQQNVADFENLNLSSESYWDGSDLSGQHNNYIFSSSFSSGDYQFHNAYDTTYGSVYGYWSSGWIYSNMTDSTTSGATNQYSAKAGSGWGLSANYAIGKSNSTIVFNQTGSFSVHVTNSTYAANSMRDGDSFAKKFTNADQDFFKLHIYGFYNGSISDSTEFYLADFTHADSTLDYIVTDWQYVELLPGLYDSVSFDLSSSDAGAFGMNTPAYFCVDNVGNYPLSAVEISENKFSVYPNPSSDFINLKSLENNVEYMISIFDIFGKEIINNLKNPKQIEISSFVNGQYILKIETKDGIINERLLKI